MVLKMLEKKSKLVLGTAQLGGGYGLLNPRQKFTSEGAAEILDTALSAGINTFDTAYAYGQAEDLLGNWVASRNLSGKVNIISKLKPHALNDYADGTRASDIVAREVEKSLQRLKIDKLDGYLLHSPHYIYLKHVVAGLRQAQEAGSVANIGVSIYNEEEALQAVELPVDYIQVPYNVFDRRLERTDFFELAARNQVTVFARSPFLKGLLVAEPDQIPAYLGYARPLVEELIALNKKYHLSPLQSALMFSVSNPALDHIVFGVDTVEQLRENLKIVTKPPAGVQAAIEELRQKFQDINRNVVVPSVWTKVKWR